MSLLGQGKNDEAGSVHVESVDRGLVNASRDGGADAVGDRVDLIFASPGNGEEAARFFDNDDVFVLMNNPHFAGTFRMASIICRVCSMVCCG